MDVYLPIANLAVNGLVIVGLGALMGILSGMRHRSARGWVGEMPLGCRLKISYTLRM